MSRNVKNANISAHNNKYCKVCQDAGKSESEYRSHFTRETRDPNSKVTCPTLLSLECRYCYNNGHTVKYCPVRKDNEKRRKYAESSARYSDSVKKADVKPKGKSIIDNNVFGSLESDSEDDVVVNKHADVKEEFPALCASVSSNNNSVAINYAMAVSKPVPAPVPVVAKVVPAPVLVVAKSAPWEPSSKVNLSMKKTNWADWSDSEDDEDDNDQINQSSLIAHVEDDDW